MPGMVNRLLTRCRVCRSWVKPGEGIVLWDKITKYWKGLCSKHQHVQARGSGQSGETSAHERVTASAYVSELARKDCRRPIGPIQADSPISGASVANPALLGGH